MGKTRLIEAWRRGQRTGFKLREVRAELERHGFLVSQGKKHWKAEHPELVGCPDFPVGLVTFSAHAFGNQGEIHPEAIQDFVKAIGWIENK